MLFDLRGKRRRTVQVTYAALAFLMAAGLVAFGIGSDTSGGLSDIFTGGGGGKSTANKTVEKRIEAAEKRLAANPRDQAALATIVRSRYSLASLDTNQQTGKFGANGKKELTKAAAAWERYLEANPKKADPSLAAVMLNTFGKNGLNRPSDAAATAEIIADTRNDAQAYIRLAACSTVAGQTRKATLAGDKAVALAPKGQAKAVKQYIEQAKAAKTAPTLCSQ
ncbi:MAG TPA: hypothetical protein VF545_05145 [Thermoleophilaceae bacterium]|jgi:tetratricopeptide (TPR) repeat protein